MWAWQLILPNTVLSRTAASVPSQETSSTSFTSPSPSCDTSRMATTTWIGRWVQVALFTVAALGPGGFSLPFYFTLHPTSHFYRLYRLQKKRLLQCLEGFSFPAWLQHSIQFLTFSEAGLVPCQVLRSSNCPVSSSSILSLPLLAEVSPAERRCAVFSGLVHQIIRTPSSADRCGLHHILTKWQWNGLHCCNVCLHDCCGGVQLQ